MINSAILSCLSLSYLHYLSCVPNELTSALQLASCKLELVLISLCYHWREERRDVVNSGGSRGGAKGACAPPFGSK